MDSAGEPAVPRLKRKLFYAQLIGFLRDLKPGSSLPEPDPDTHLWEAGYLDSFAMLQVIDHLEAMLGREIPLGPAALPNFFTLNRIYETYFAEEGDG